MKRRHPAKTAGSVKKKKMGTNRNEDNKPNSLPSSPFSQEVPQLLKQHLEHLLASAISQDVIQERGYESVLGKARLKELGFGVTQQRAPGILIPGYFNTKIVGYQFRPDSPRLNPKGKPIKYENLPGSANYVDCLPKCQKDLGNPQVPLLTTEGFKKGDALVSHGACCVIVLTGVWNWRGQNDFGGKTALPEWEIIALNGRLVYLCFDSDTWTNPQVKAALLRLAALLEQRGAKISVIHLPSGTDGTKVGVDDYLAAGHSLADVIKLAQPLTENTVKTEKGKYTIEKGRFCEVRHPTQGNEYLVPLCNFTANITQELIRDNGAEITRSFEVAGVLGSGRHLSEVDVRAENFSSLSWLKPSWGAAPIIAAGNTVKDKLREAIELASGDVPIRRVYTHTGWRVVDGERCFLTASGALGKAGVEVELERGLDRYRLPTLRENVTEAMNKSLDFLAVAPHDITMPLWGAMYLAPLSELLNPAFTLWLIGPSGALKTSLATLALSHFGAFDIRTVPATWEGTSNYLEKLLFLAKDLPVLIDDYAPQPDTKTMRDYEQKVEIVDRAQGNRIGRARLKSDTSIRGSYNPRGMVIATGETLPSGHQSRMAREFVVTLEKGQVGLARLTQAQKDTAMYSHAMAGYILWLKDSWSDLVSGKLEKTWEDIRSRAQREGQHLRLSEAVAWLYVGFVMGFQFAEHVGAYLPPQADDLRNEVWDILLKLADAQGSRVEQERPGIRFMEVLATLVAQDKVFLPIRIGADGEKPAPHQELIGYRDENWVFLLPEAAQKAVVEFCRRLGQLFPWNSIAVRKDLDRLGLLEHPQGRLTAGVRTGDGRARVYRIPIDKWHKWLKVDLDEG